MLQNNVPVDLEVDSSDNGTDMGLDHDALNHIIGDIATDVLDADGRHWTDFKAITRKKRSSSNKKPKKNKAIWHRQCLSK